MSMLQNAARQLSLCRCLPPLSEGTKAQHGKAHAAHAEGLQPAEAVAGSSISPGRTVRGELIKLVGYRCSGFCFLAVWIGGSGRIDARCWRLWVQLSSFASCSESLSIY